MSDESPNSRSLDAAYKPFPPFLDWLAELSFDPMIWDQERAKLDTRQGVSQATLDRARRIATRAAAIDTGAIEGLYESDRGFTYTVAFETAAWELETAARGEQVRPLFEAQLHAYEYVLTLATGAQPISEAAVRELHTQICKAQLTYDVMTAVGPQHQPLPKGQYKILPNHVRTRRGEDHSYAPVDMTPAEMQRLVLEMRSDAFDSAHPILQATYAHYCLVVIHPFADGNGRVARALASVFTYREISAPIVILTEQKADYLDALGAADEGSSEIFLDFMTKRSIETMEMIDESIKAALFDAPEEAATEIELLFHEKRLSPSEVDRIALSFAKSCIETLEIAWQKLKLSSHVDFIVVGKSGRPPIVVQEGFRIPSVGYTLNLTASSKSPAAASVSRVIDLWVSKRATDESPIYLRFEDKDDGLRAKIAELHPRISAAVRLRMSIFADRAISELLTRLKPLVKAALDEEN